MVDVVVVGTIGLDDVKTPFGNVRGVLGGSGVYVSFAASFFSRPGLVSIAGTDFPSHYFDLMKKRGINLEGVQIKGKSFRWEGLYEYDMNEAKTLRTELNALAEFNPKLPLKYKNAKYVFLANIDPDLQMKALEQIKNPKFVAMDTMDFWIENKRDRLIEVIKKVDVLVMNDGEARQLFETVNLVKAADKALDLGPKAVVIKKGEHGALLFVRENGVRKHFNAPGYPLEIVKDPTGCGDSFGGGFIGYLAKTDDLCERNLRKAVMYGSVIASFNAEDFSLNRQKTLKHEEIEKRLNEFKDMREF
ncbi:MAG: PfkB family carbohydrate kinase [Candidatus Woesearchaeota archaeon]|nr:PfkB family carbohydrate kinase [Candidatus Woesearchaeota archaeon]